MRMWWRLLGGRTANGRQATGKFLFEFYLVLRWTSTLRYIYEPLLQAYSESRIVVVPDASSASATPVWRHNPSDSTADTSTARPGDEIRQRDMLSV
jgi:hypothetical protein